VEPFEGIEGVKAGIVYFFEKSASSSVLFLYLPSMGEVAVKGVNSIFRFFSKLGNIHQLGILITLMKNEKIL